MVNYITFKRTISDVYANFLPNVNGCHIDFTPIGEVNNWECVDDPVATPDEDATYVYSTATNLQYDLYGLSNYTTESGTINYIQIYGRAKSHIHSQHASGIFKLVLTDNNCTNIYKSDDKEITTDYVTYDNTWTENPRTSNAFTWEEFNNLQIGVECSSPSIGVAHITTFRPNAPGDITQLTPVGDTTNWECVDEIVRDNMTTRVEVLKDEGYRYDLYNLTNHTTEVGPISKIIVYMWVYISDSEDGDADTVIKIGGNTYYDGKIPNNNEWVLLSTEYALNPATSLAWTWTDIDNLQAGIKLNPPVDVPGYNSCTQVYVEVYHTEQESPEIRTTQCYVKVNYTTCHLMIAPEEVSTDHMQNIKEMNMWNGERIVFGESRSKWSLLLKGQDWENTACNRILDIKQLGLEGLPITVTGLNNINWDTEWMIKSIGWKLIYEKPLHYEWIILLEKT